MLKTWNATEPINCMILPLALFVPSPCKIKIFQDVQIHSMSRFCEFCTQALFVANPRSNIVPCKKVKCHLGLWPRWRINDCFTGIILPSVALNYAWPHNGHKNSSKTNICYKKLCANLYK